MRKAKYKIYGQEHRVRIKLHIYSASIMLVRCRTQTRDISPRKTQSLIAKRATNAANYEVVKVLFPEHLNMA